MNPEQNPKTIQVDGQAIELEALLEDYQRLLTKGIKRRSDAIAES